MIAQAVVGHSVILTSKAITAHEYRDHWIQQLRSVWNPNEVGGLTQRQRGFRALFTDEFASFDELERRLQFPEWCRLKRKDHALHRLTQSKWCKRKRFAISGTEVAFTPALFKRLYADYGFQNLHSAAEHNKKPHGTYQQCSRSEGKLAGFKAWLQRKHVRVHHLLRDPTHALEFLSLLHSRKADSVLQHLYYLFEERVSRSYLSMQSELQIEMDRHGAGVTVLPVGAEINRCRRPDNTADHIVCGWRMLKHCERVCDFMSAHPSVKWFKIGLTTDASKRWAMHAKDGWEGMIDIFQCKSVEAACFGEMTLIDKYYDLAQQPDQSMPVAAKATSKCVNDRKSGGKPGPTDPASGTTPCVLYVLWSKQTDSPRETAAAELKKPAEENTKPQSMEAERDLAAWVIPGLEDHSSEQEEKEAEEEEEHDEDESEDNDDDDGMTIADEDPEQH